MSRVTLPKLHRQRAEGAKIPMLTCYDASFAALLEASGIELLLVGDSLGMTVQGHATTLPVTLDQMAYHTEAVVRGAAGQCCWRHARLFTLQSLSRACGRG